MRYRIALCGFSEFEFRAMHFSFLHPIDDAEGYDMVDAVGDSDFAIVDADSSPAVKGVVLSDRVARSVFVGASAPVGAGAHVPRPIDPPRIIRALVELTQRIHAPEQHPALLRAFDEPDEIVISEPPLLMDAVTFATTERRSLGVPANDAAAAPQTAKAAKAAARAAARRARLSHTQTDPGQLEQMRDVLVMDGDAAASKQLSGLLELFGFRVHAARTLAHAADILSRRPLVAAFLDIALGDGDEGDGLTLLQTINDLPRLVGYNAPVVLLVTPELRPADRVRATLAGVAAPLIKPVSRGDVARALESCGVLLPADARRL